MLKLSRLLIVAVMLLTPTLAAAQEPTVQTDRLGWTQTMTAAEQPLVTFAIFVDNVRGPLPAVTCTVTATAGTYDCQTAYPPMTPGPHTIELVAIRTEGALTAESLRSAPFAIRLIVGPETPTGLRNIRGGG